MERIRQVDMGLRSRHDNEMAIRDCVLTYWKIMCLFKHIYRRLILSSRCDVIVDSINIRTLFSWIMHIFFPYVISNRSQFRKVAKLWGCGELFCQKCRRTLSMLSSSLRAFQLLIDALAQLLTIWQWYGNCKIWPTIRSFDLITWPLTKKNYRVLSCISSICGPSLVTIGQKLQPVSRSKQTERQTNHQTNILPKMKFWQVNNPNEPCVLVLDLLTW